VRRGSVRASSNEAVIREKVHPTIKGRRRFYKQVAVQALDGSGATKYEVQLDGRSLRTPGRRAMHFDSQELAMAVALEWDAQAPEGIEPATMPLMSLMSTWLDQTSQDRPTVITGALKFLPTDTCCFFNEEAPATRNLVRRQEKHFFKLLDWLADDWGVELSTTNGITKVKHEDEAVRRVEAMLDALDDAALTAVQCATMEGKSVVLALALVLRRVTPKAAEEIARLEEEFQMEQWGLVEGGHDLDRAASKVQFASTSAFLRLLDGEDGHEHRVHALRQACEKLAN